MDRRRFLLAVGGTLPFVAGCSTRASTTPIEDPHVASTSDVSLDDSQFDPRNIHVPVGTTVTWTNETSTAHTVTAASENWSFDEEISGYGAAEFDFTESGVYDVYCRFHGAADLTGMSMKVGVGDASIDAPLGLTNQASTAPM